MLDCFSSAGKDGDAIAIHGLRPDDVNAIGERYGATAAAYAGASGFTAATGEVCLLPSAEGGVEAVLFGLGKPGRSPELSVGRLPGRLPAGTYVLRDGFNDPELDATAWAMGAYSFTRYRDSNREPRRLVIPSGVNPDRVSAIAGGVYLARDLINTPANDLGPVELAKAAANLARTHDAVYSEIVGEALLVEGFPLVHAVGAGAGASRAPRLVEFNWGSRSDPKVTLVGKGVCFDTGGLDIKPSSGMLLMKKDMGGAACVLGLASMIMAMDLPVRLRVIIPAVENAISDAAFRPSDIYSSRKGLTVEIGNTDAEGRLVLADALTLACEGKPDLLVDLATLTGAARVALGPEVMPFFATEDAFADAVYSHGQSLADPVWRLPLWDGYMSMLDSKSADINNVGRTPFAGAVTAALFLSRFVEEGTNWLHGDIYGWTPTARPGHPEGGAANTIRALFAAIEERYTA